MRTVSLNPTKKEMIYNVFDLGDATAKDIMVPRVHVTFADVESTYDELIDIFREDKFTRLPVYKEQPEQHCGNHQHEGSSSLRQK